MSRSPAMGARADEATAVEPRRRWPQLEAADAVVVAYATFVLALVVWRLPSSWPLLAMAQLALIGGVAALAVWTHCSPASRHARFLHRWYPVVLLLVLYPQAGALGHLLVASDLDSLVLGLEDALFPGRWWATLPPLLSPLAREAVHAVYFSYYLLLFLPALLAERRARAAVAEYVTVLTATMLLHFAASFLFPVAGPSPHGANFPGSGPFTALTALAYRLFDRGGLAFPSTHVAASVVACWYAARLYPRARWAYALWAAAIAASTVLGGYHYSADVAAGLVTGALCTALGRRRATRQRPSLTPWPEPEPGPSPLPPPSRWRR